MKKLGLVENYTPRGIWAVYKTKLGNPAFCVDLCIKKMGVISRQATKLTIANLFGLLLGVFNTLFIYPLDKHIYGLAMFVLSVGLLLDTFASLGLNSLTLRFFPRFKDPTQANRGYLAFAIIYYGVGWLLFFIFFKLFSSSFLQMLLANYPDNSKDLSLFFQFIPWIVALTSIQSFFTIYLSQFQRVVIPGIVVNVVPKLWIPATFLLTYHGLINEQGMVYCTIALLALSALTLVVYTSMLGQLSFTPQWKFYDRPQLKEMLHFSAFSILGTVGTQMALRIDQTMIGTLLSTDALGLYALAQTIAVAVEMPAKSVINITGPIIGDLFKKDDFHQINELFKKSALNMTATGIFLFLGLVLVVDDLFALSHHKDVLVPVQKLASVLVIAKLFDMFTGPNDFIIGLSKYYKFNLILIFLLSIANVVFSVTFIHIYGIYGPPLALVFFLFTFNAIKTYFIWKKFKMLPFSRNSITLIVLGAIAVGIHFIVPSFRNNWLNLFLGLGILSITYILPILYLKLTPDLIGLVLNIVKHRKLY
ncbi:MAG: oligosaccharide flippase family protein [Haliscomenobacter sp.]|uniref:lipopolysaccharide biosynthesis protein n=1 Tax=Haliscomenobacter sp. TaxID=2717303 RepID=UPI0029B43394|nr:oligosaccharide flippase family protein [Haliscomenobacter sp.]MDX2069006.1 oligosaccharide flippase family protein [Haliscomenobacter sp.]